MDNFSCLPTGSFRKLDLSTKHEEFISHILGTPDYQEWGFFIDCDLEYAPNIKEKIENFRFSPEYETSTYSQAISINSSNPNMHQLQN